MEEARFETEVYGSRQLSRDWFCSTSEKVKGCSTLLIRAKGYEVVTATSAR